ncbi:MAG TPA: GNAT family N-acetyltransferase [Acidimicrobiia bacterium]|nr:GNAT family N-acetyltransferase [Acidimicrobiia bacterium]
MTSDDGRCVLRARTAGDLSACAQLACEVHIVDGYPVEVPGGDFLAFVKGTDALGAWVAEIERNLVGHVALHRASSPAAMRLARSKLEVPASSLGIVARLLVAPSARRSGIGSRLLSVAANEARARGLAPILDVVSRHRDAIALYERENWTRLGSTHVTLMNGKTVDEYVYAAPLLRCQNQIAQPRRHKSRHTASL